MKTKQTKDNIELSPISLKSNENNNKLQVYIAEYSSLLERITYYLNIQAVFIAGAIVWVSTTFLGAYNEKSYTLGLIGLTGFQFIQVIINGFRNDQYKIALYLQKYLKPKMEEIIQTEYDNYQSYIVKLQVKTQYLFRHLWELFLSVGLIVFFLLKFYSIQGNKTLIVIIFLLNLIFLSLSTYQSIILFKDRKEINKVSNKDQN